MRARENGICEWLSVVLAGAALVTGGCDWRGFGKPYSIGPGDIDFGQPGGFSPDLGTGPTWPEEIVQQETPPPPISGGTLTMLADGQTAVAADADRDHVFAVDVVAQRVTADIALAAGDEPGRVVQDGAGRVHVVLRRAGAVATLDLVAQTVVARRPVCTAPRGLAWEAASDRLHVACAGGELVSLPAAGGDAVRTLQLERDLRDVVVDGDALVVTRFRSAQVLRVDGNGAVMERTGPAAVNGFSPHVAWRAVAAPGGGVAIVHQIETDAVVPTKIPGGYGGGGFGTDGGTLGPGIVQAVVSVVRHG
jgi:hypothetical protein